MTIFDEREQSEEAKFKHELHLAFKMRNRRNKMMGLWIAQDYLGLMGDEAENYAREVMLADFDLPGDADLLRKISTDVAAAGKEISQHRLRKQLDELAAIAREQMLKG